MVNIAIRKKIAYPVFAAVLMGLIIWQYYLPETHWLGKDKEFWYTTVYLALVVGMGIPVLVKWRHSRYFTVRTISCMLTQLFFGYLLIYFLLPYSWRGVVIAMNLYPFTAFAQNLWPLEIFGLLVPVYFGFSAVVVGWLLYTVITSLIVMPVLVLRFGRAYCSWLCACGNLAETFGDPFRTQSPKGRRSIKAEWMIVPFVLFAIAATIGIGLGLGNRDVLANDLGVLGEVRLRRGTRPGPVPAAGQPGLVPVLVPVGRPLWRAEQSRRLTHRGKPDVHGLWTM